MVILRWGWSNNAFCSDVGVRVEKGQSDHRGRTLTFSWGRHPLIYEAEIRAGREVTEWHARQKGWHFGIYSTYHIGGSSVAYFLLAELFIFMLQSEKKHISVQNVWLGLNYRVKRFLEKVLNIFLYQQQTPWKDQNPRWVDPTNEI